MTDLAVAGQAIAWMLSAALGGLTLLSLVGHPFRVPRLLTFAVAPAFGFGISSLVWFVIWCRGGSGSPLVPLSAEFLLLLWLLRHHKIALVQLWPRLPGKSSRWFLVAGLFSFACAAIYFWRFLEVGPYAGWDAWAIWNLHARALVTGGGRFWKAELYKLGWSHPDYPLLLPLTVSRLWLFAGREVSSAPAWVATYFTFGSAVVVGAALAALKGRLSATLAVVTLFASHEFLWIGFQEYADVPLGFYILSAFVFLALSESTENLRLLFASGFCAGLGAWTKNEGSMFLACFLLSQLLCWRWGNTWRLALTKLGRIFLGALLPLAATIAYKHRVPARSDVLSWFLTKSGWSRALDWHRVVFVLRRFGETLWHLETWFLSFVAVLVIYCVLIGVERSGIFRKMAFTACLTFGLLLLIYVGVYTSSPGDVAEYMKSSLDRLYIQLWPACVFQLFLLTRIPVLPANKKVQLVSN